MEHSDDSASHPYIYTSLKALQKLKYRTQGINLQANQPINSVLNGSHASKLRGRGLNFEEMRQYHKGDDIRTMDWRATIRTGRPHVRVYNEEKERNVYLLVDQRQSMFFGSQYKLKSVIAAEVASLIAWGAIASSDKVGAIVFNDHQVKVLKPKCSELQIIQILKEITAQNNALSAGGIGSCFEASINQVFESLARLAGHDSLVILISDGRGWNDKTTEYIKGLRQHNEFMFCQVLDPLEREIPNISHTVISDGQWQLEVNLQELATKYQHKVEERLGYLNSVAKKYRLPVLSVDTLSQPERQLRTLLGRLG
ncbi:DUF58 domain-containing protein [Vibrio lamellibrachiae]|uniref:DUF58 domain-containing protein n=1 Tax=Vibrio lamellibrachiae TaxID=2910253 RepID=UPI003D0F2553